MTATASLSRSALAEVVRLRPFRRLWLVFGLSSLGDWLGLLATSSFASAQLSSPAAQGAAFGGVIVVQLLPWLLLGPLAGVLADRYDRRHIMVSVDVTRFALFASIPAVAALTDEHAVAVGWAAVASFTAQVGAMLWAPAKEAAVPNLLPARRLETANQLTIITTYGVTPVLAALVFAGTSRLPAIGDGGAAVTALYFDALTFLACAAVVGFGVREISGRGRAVPAEDSRAAIRAGLRCLARTPLLRGLVVGLLGAFAGAGIVVGAARFYSRSLGGGDATFGLLFGGLFVGFGLGVLVGPQVVGRLSRRRVFGLSVQLAAVGVVLLAVTPSPAVALPEVALVGAGAGMAFLCGITLIGAEVPDDVRGRVFSLIQSMTRVVLLLTVAAAGTLAGLTSALRMTVGPVDVPVDGSRALYLLAGFCGMAVGRFALRRMDDRSDIPLPRDVWHAVTRRADRERR
ncbi:MFS transporter [Actinoplanes palleronii]|uniref:Major facilitator superfamily (MFS) profile domain-containing protein n=1 Tax=Actinoplanes palleronii TaxID=113570 RepID=A0ABQ4BBU3_9ACTN|nr:MFS transporter [Actinoplanes palleronii]GIE68167.1 hypothetical protein Apa02nite_042750 [Actinoplanes palleronii]